MDIIWIVIREKEDADLSDKEAEEVIRGAFKCLESIPHKDKLEVAELSPEDTFYR